MFQYDLLESLIAQSGKTKTYLCKQMGRPPYYLRDVIKQKNKIPDDLQEILAQELGTTVAALNGEKEKPTPEGELSGKALELVQLFEKASPELRAAALAVLRAAEDK